MGMYDSFYLEIKCPYCGMLSEIECQTKELDSQLEEWRKGDYIGTTQFNFLECIADCRTAICKAWQNKKMGYSSGFGRSCEVRVRLEEGIVTGEYEILDLWDEEEGEANGETED